MGTKPVIGLAGVILAGGMLCGCCDKGCRLGNNTAPPAVPPPTQTASQQTQQQQPLGWNNQSRNVTNGQQSPMTDPNIQRTGLTQPATPQGPQNNLPPLGSSSTSNAFDQGQNPGSTWPPSSDTGMSRPTPPAPARTGSLMKDVMPGSDAGRTGSLMRDSTPSSDAGLGAPQNTTPGSSPLSTQAKYQSMQAGPDSQPLQPADPVGVHTVQPFPPDSRN
jgi:hypothetical protein